MTNHRELQANSPDDYSFGEVVRQAFRMKKTLLSIFLFGAVVVVISRSVTNQNRYIFKIPVSIPERVREPFMPFFRRWMATEEGGKALAAVIPDVMTATTRIEPVPESRYMYLIGESMTGKLNQSKVVDYLKYTDQEVRQLAAITTPVDPSLEIVSVDLADKFQGLQKVSSEYFKLTEDLLGEIPKAQRPEHFHLNGTLGPDGGLGLYALSILEHLRPNEFEKWRKVRDTINAKAVLYKKEVESVRLAEGTLSGVQAASYREEVARGIVTRYKEPLITLADTDFAMMSKNGILIRAMYPYWRSVVVVGTICIFLLMFIASFALSAGDKKRR